MRRRVTDKSARERAKAVAGEQPKQEEPPKVSAKDRTLPLPGTEDQPKPKLPASVKEHSLDPTEGRPGRPVGTASAKRVGAVHMEGYENIIDNLFEFDADAGLQEVIDFLRLSEKPSRAEYGMLVDSLDEAAEKVGVAHQLVAHAMVRCKLFEIDVGVLKAGLHEQCEGELFEQYRQRVRDVQEEYKGRKEKPPTVSKPTVGDIEAYKLNNYHDEWMDLEGQLAKAVATREYFVGLCRAVEGRQRDLRQMVASSRGAS